MTVVDATRQAPKPTTELFRESLHLSPRQREVLDALHTFPDGATVAELSKQLGMHANTVRGHLDELQMQGAVRHRQAPITGRGRPTLIFSTRLPDNRAIAHEYLSLIAELADTIDPQQAQLVGQRWAHTMAGDEDYSDPKEAINRVFSRLRDLGFDPELIDAPAPAEPTTICLNACPFARADGVPSVSICHVHEGFLRELLAQGRALDSELEPLRADHTCRIHLRPTAA